MKYSIIKIITAIALFVCLMLSLLTIQSHVLFYQEQHSLFLYSGNYISHTLHTEGIMGLIGAFMVQFYHIPWLGAAIVSLLLVGIYLLTEAIIMRLTGLRDLLQLGVAAAAGLYFTLDNIEESPAWVVVAFLGLLIVWLLTLFIRRKKKTDTPLPLWKTIIAIALPAAYLYGGLLLEMHGYNRPERAMIRAERAVKQHNWDEAIDITGRYLSTGRTNKLMLYLRNIALAEKGVLLDSLFTYPQKVGMQSLAFPWHSDSRESEYGHLVHEVTGDINAAHHWAFEAMTVWGETAPHLLDLARYNVALGRPKVALKFADKLGQSLFYRDDAARIRRQVSGEEKTDLRYAVPDTATVKWVNVLDFRPNLMQNYLADTTNSITRQYLLASMLLSGDMRTLIPMVRKADLKVRNIREAILIYSLDPLATPLQEYGLAVDDATGNDFAPFYRMLRRCAPDDGNFLQAYGKSFWYYLHVIKPSVKED